MLEWLPILLRQHEHRIDRRHKMAKGKGFLNINPFRSSKSVKRSKVLPGVSPPYRKRAKESEREKDNRR